METTSCSVQEPCSPALIDAIDNAKSEVLTMAINFKESTILAAVRYCVRALWIPTQFIIQSGVYKIYR